MVGKKSMYLPSSLNSRLLLVIFLYDLDNVKFKVNPCLFIVQAALMKDATISVNRCLWSPDGSIFGIASKPTSYVHLILFLCEQIWVL